MVGNELTPILRKGSAPAQRGIALCLADNSPDLSAVRNGTVPIRATVSLRDGIYPACTCSTTDLLFAFSSAAIKQPDQEKMGNGCRATWVICDARQQVGLVGHCLLGRI